MKIRSLLKWFVAVFSILALAMMVQSCSNPFDSASRFYGKWKCNSHVDARGGTQLSGCKVYTCEFLPDGKSCVMILYVGQNLASLPLDYNVSRGVLKTGVSNFYRYEFSGNKLILRNAENGEVITLVRDDVK